MAPSRSVRHPQRQHEQPRVVGHVRPGLRVAAAALVGAGDEARLAVAGGVGERGAHGDRQPRPRRRGREARAVEQHELVVAALPHRHRVGAEQLAELVDRGAGDRTGAGRGRQRRRGPLQELQPPGGGLLGGQQRRVVQRDRSALADLAEQGGVVLLEPRRVAHPPGDEQAHHPAARPQRHGDGGVRAERRSGSALPLAACDARQVGVVHGDQLCATRADEALVETPRGVEPPQDVGVLGPGGGDGDGARRAHHVDEPGQVDEPFVHQRAHEHVATGGHRGLGVHRRADGVDQVAALPFAVPVVDVEAAPDVRAVAERGAAVEHPPVAAVGAAQAVLQLERLARGDRGRADRRAALGVAGVHAGPPAAAEILAGPRAGELQPGPVDQRAAPVGGIDPDQRGGGVGERLELRWSPPGRQHSHTRLNV